MLLKPKEQHKRGTGVTEKRDGRVVLSDAKYRQQRLTLMACGGRNCFKCDVELNADTLHTHHSAGRGIGGGKRDDRIWVPCSDPGWWERQRKKYPFMPKPPVGKKWNLFALCERHHQDDEHHQGCAGTPQWSQKNESSVADDSGEDSLFAEAFEITSSGDLSENEISQDNSSENYQGE